MRAAFIFHLMNTSAGFTCQVIRTVINYTRHDSNYVIDQSCITQVDSIVVPYAVHVIEQSGNRVEIKVHLLAMECD